MDASIQKLARQNHTTILRAMAATSQVRIAELVGVSEATVSRFKDVDGTLEKLTVLAAACGVRFVLADACQVDMKRLQALSVLAARAIELDAESSGWGDL